MVTPTGLANYQASLNRVMAKAWNGIDTSSVAKAPDLLNNESLEAVNAAGTGVIAMLSVNTSDQVVAPNPIIFTGGTVAADANSTRIIVAEKTIADAGTNLFDVALPAAAMFGCVILWSIQASDGTDHQAFTGITTVSAVNKAGSYTSTVTELATIQAKAVSSGTLTEAITVVTGTNKITVKLTPTGSLTETTYRVSYTLLNNSRQAITLV